MGVRILMCSKNAVADSKFHIKLLVGPCKDRVVDLQQRITGTGLWERLDLLEAAFTFSGQHIALLASFIMHECTATCTAA